MSTEHSEASAVAEIVRKHITHKIEVIEHPTEKGLRAPLLIMPDGAGLAYAPLKEEFDAYRTQPERRRGTAEMATLESFIEHVVRFADEDSVVFADTMATTAPCLLAVLDYHRKRADGAPRFGLHRVTYKFPFSTEWTAWLASNGKGKAMSQAGFAEFIEDRLADILHPQDAGDSAQAFADQFGAFAPPSELLSLSRSFTAHVKSKVKAAWNPSSGAAEVSFTSDHGDAQGEPLRVPHAFLIGIPIFRGGERYQVCVRLRYRADGGDGTVSWFYDISRAQDTVDMVIAKACEKVHAETHLPVHFGKPEQG